MTHIAPGKEPYQKIPKMLPESTSNYLSDKGRWFKQCDKCMCYLMEHEENTSLELRNECEVL